MKHSHEGVPKVEVPEEAGEQQFTPEEYIDIQSELIKRYYKKYKEKFPEGIDQAASVWIPTYAESFNALTYTDPDLVEILHDDPERYFEIVHAKLYTHTLH